MFNVHVWVGLLGLRNMLTDDSLTTDAFYYGHLSAFFSLFDGCALVSFQTHYAAVLMTFSMTDTTDALFRSRISKECVHSIATAISYQKFKIIQANEEICIQRRIGT